MPKILLKGFSHAEIRKPQGSPTYGMTDEYRSMMNDTRKWNSKCASCQLSGTQAHNLSFEGENGYIGPFLIGLGSAGSSQRPGCTHIAALQWYWASFVTGVILGGPQLLEQRQIEPDVWL
jgi:hypothetical protein